MILFWHQRKNGETSRGLLDRALLAYAETLGRRKPRKARRAVAEGSHGKPYLPEMPHVFFSVSHSGDLWICLLDKAPVGVDCELAVGEAGAAPTGQEGAAPQGRPFAKLAARYFAPAEQQLFEALGADETAFLQIWTRKEAYVKYTGKGLSQGLSSFSVAEGSDLQPGAVCFAERLPAAEEAWNGQEGDLSPVSLQPLQIPYHGAVAACCGRKAEVAVLPLPVPAEEDLLDAAKEAALDFLSVKERTEAEVRKKLKEKEFDSTTIDQVLDFLKECSYVDDASYALRYVRWGASRGRGPLRLERDLTEKGIPRNLVKEAVRVYREEGGAEDPFCSGSADCTADAPADPFFEAALAEGRRILENAGSPEDPDEKLRAKILRRLASKGYSAGTAYKVVSRLFS